MAAFKPIDINDLLTDIQTYTLETESLFPRNILLIGEVGSGKSSMVNTIIKALLGEGKEYVPRATVGRGTTQSQTLSLKWYPNCGVTDQDIKASSYEDILSVFGGKLPNIIDMAGLGDENTPARREILQLLLEGRIPNDTTITALVNAQKKYGVGNLQQRYRPDPKLKVTNIVFVQNGKSRPPKNLIECLREVTRTTKMGTEQLVYTGELFVVITGLDLHEDQRVDDTEKPAATDSQEVTSSHHDEPYSKQQLENDVVHAFAIDGARMHSLIWWTNYCDKVGYETDLSIDGPVLQFLKRMVMVKVSFDSTSSSPLGRSFDAIKQNPSPGVLWQELMFMLGVVWLELRTGIWKVTENPTVRYVVLIIVVAVVAVFLSSLFTRKPEIPKFVPKTDEYE